MVERKRRRTTQQVKDDIMQAVGSVLSKHGLTKLGVDEIAAEAGMDKATLYRHYKDFFDLLKKYIEQEDIWINFFNNEIYSVDENNLASYMSNMFEEQFNKLLNNTKQQELMIWELAEKSILMKDISQKREDMATDLLDNINESFKYKDVSSNNIIAIIIAGIYYLTLHKDISSFCNIDINNKEHKAKFISDMKWLVESIFSTITETERIVLNCIENGLDNELIAKITEIDIKRVEELYNVGSRQE